MLAGFLLPLPLLTGDRLVVVIVVFLFFAIILITIEG